jgi:hypothetical protein
MAKPNTFPFNPKKDPCPICGKHSLKEAMLVPIAGTRVGNNMNALQVHIDCLLNDPVYYPNAGLVMITCHDYDQD